MSRSRSLVNYAVTVRGAHLSAHPRLRFEGGIKVALISRNLYFVQMFLFSAFSDSSKSLCPTRTSVVVSFRII